MKNIKYIAVVIVLFLMGCDEGKFSQIKVIELPEHTPRIAVTAKLSNNLSPSIFVSHSQKLLDNRAYETMDNATVNLYKGDDLLMDFQWNDITGTYLPTGTLPEFEEGITYKMEASATGYEPIVATQKLPKKCEIVAVEYEKDGFVTEWGETMDILEVEILDDGSEENFYNMEVWASGTFPNGEEAVIYAGGYSEDPIMEYGYDEEYTPDVTFNGGKYVMRFFINKYYQDQFQINQGGSLDGLVINVNSYSKEYYRYDVSVATFEDSQDIPFVEPVLISTNWDNGFGVFGLYTVTNYEYEF